VRRQSATATALSHGNMIHRCKEFPPFQRACVARISAGEWAHYKLVQYSLPVLAADGGEFSFLSRPARVRSRTPQ
jgi:hypothetical protein